MGLEAHIDQKQKIGQEFRVGHWRIESSFRNAFLELFGVALVGLLDIVIIIAIFIDTNIELNKLVPTSHEKLIEKIVLVSILP